MSELGPLARALAEKKRTCHDFDVRGFLGLTGNLPKLKVRLATVREQDKAIAEASAYVKRLAGNDADVAKDPDILENSKTAHILATACRDTDRPDELPAFPTGQFLLENTTTDQLATLLHLYNGVRNKESAAPLSLEDDRLEALIAMCSLASNTEIPDATLAAFPREYLVQAVVLLSGKLMDTRDQLEKANRERQGGHLVSAPTGEASADETKPGSA